MRKYLFLLIPVSLLVVLFALSNVLFFKDYTPSTEITDNSAAMRVFIKDLHDTNTLKINSDIANVIEYGLYYNASLYGKGLYTGTIRTDSYSDSLLYSSSGNTHMQQVLIDIDPIGVTYLVSVRSLGGFISVDAVCAPKEDQLDPSITCKVAEWV